MFLFGHFTLITWLKLPRRNRFHWTQLSTASFGFKEFKLQRQRINCQHNVVLVMAHYNTAICHRPFMKSVWLISMQRVVSAPLTSLFGEKPLLKNQAPEVNLSYDKLFGINFTWKFNNRRHPAEVLTIFFFLNYFPSYLFSFYPACSLLFILQWCAWLLSSHSSRLCFPLFGAVRWN